MQLSIIIINYKTIGLVLNCLDSIVKFNHNDFEIIVVDNDSNDNAKEILRNNYPEIIFHQMGYNSGFARANNEGIKMSKGEVVLLLNSDTLNLEDGINNCLLALKNSNYVAAGVQLLNEDLSPQISGNYAMRGGLNYLLPLPYLGTFLKWLAGLFNMSKPNVPNAKGTVEVDWINGAFLMVRKNIIDEAGLLDPDFFLYAEEAEWCSRLKKQGSLCIFGNYNVIHLQGESAASAFNSVGKGYFNLFDKKGLQIMLSNFVRIRKQFGLGWYFFNLIIYFLSIFIFGIGLLFNNLFFPKRISYSIQQLKGYTINVLRLISFAPKIVKGKPYFYKVL